MRKSSKLSLASSCSSASSALIRRRIALAGPRPGARLRPGRRPPPRPSPASAAGCLGRSHQRDVALDRDSESLRPAVSDRGRRHRRIPGPLAEQPRAPGTTVVVEAVGRDLGSNVVEVEHVDVFEGADRTLVAPTYNSLLPNNAVVTTVDPGFNRFMNAWDYGGQNQLYGWAYPTGTGGNGIPIRLHVVGTVIERVPLQLSIPGNNFATVVAGDNVQFTVSQVTRGSLELRPQGRLRLPDAAADQSQGTGALAARPLQVDSVPAVQPHPVGRRSATPRVGSRPRRCRHWRHFGLSSFFAVILHRARRACPDRRRTSDRAADIGSRPRASGSTATSGRGGRPCGPTDRAGAETGPSFLVRTCRP